MALVVKQDVLCDPIQIRFLGPVGVIVQPQPIADLVKESFIFDDSMDHFSINKNGMVYNVH
jgi:hypothetical protein